MVLSQIWTVLSQDPLTMCLPSGEYATEVTGSECPLSVHKSFDFHFIPHCGHDRPNLRPRYLMLQLQEACFSHRKLKVRNG